MTNITVVNASTLRNRTNAHPQALQIYHLQGVVDVLLFQLTSGVKVFSFFKERWSCLRHVCQKMNKKM